MNFLKMTMSFLSVFTMTVAPLAQAAAKKQEQKEVINQYLKAMGLTTKKMTVAEYWRQVRHAQPEATRRKMDLWVSLHREQLMPKVEATSFKDGDGREQTRVTMSRDGETHTLTFIGDQDPVVKLDGVTFSHAEIFDMGKASEKYEKQKKSNKKTVALKSVLRKDVVMTYDELSKFTPRQQAEYLYKLRLTMNVAEKVLESSYGKQAALDLRQKYQWVAETILGENAEAAGNLVGRQCVVAGYISVYGGKSQSCGGLNEGSENLSQQIGNYGKSCGASAPTPCNPLVYGFNSSGGAYCVPKTEVKYATRYCNNQSPLNGTSDKVRIIESYMAAIGKPTKLHPNADGKLTPEEYEQISGYLGKLRGLINEAVALCDNDAEFVKLQNGPRKDQKSACDELRIRGMDLETFAADPVPPPELPPPARAPQACEEKPGSRLAADGKTCRCPEGTEEQSLGGDEDGGGQVGCGPIVIKEERPRRLVREKEECGFMCQNPWVLPVGLLVGAGLLAWWLWPKDNPPLPPTYTPPGPLPPTSICVLPAVLIGGICQIPSTPNPPPVVVPPPVAPSEGGSNPNNPGSSGGIR